MLGPEEGPGPPKPSTSEDVARAVEFLIHFALRLGCCVLASVAGLLALATWAFDWPKWLLGSAAIVTILSTICALIIRPQGRFHSDGTGPGIIVPKNNPDSSGVEDVHLEWSGPSHR